MKKKWYFIVNPKAGNGYAFKLSKELTEIIKSYDVESKLVYTEGKGHAAELALEAVNNDYYYIAPVGGDGTYHETIQKILNYDFVFAPIPAGTGNDFINIIGFAERFTNKTDWDIYFANNTTFIDIGVCNDRYFLNGMGIGFDAMVAAENYKYNHSVKVKKGSKNKYIWHIIKTILFYKEDIMKIKINDEENISTKKCFLNTIANGRRLAGGFYLTPLAYANDGLLDVCMINELKLFQRIIELISVIKKTHINDSVVKYFKTQKLIIKFDHEVPYHLDGELYFGDNFNISILAKKLKIVYNINKNFLI